MAFFHELIANLEQPCTRQQDAQARGGAVSDVLRFAPKRMRLRNQSRIDQFEAEIKLWQDRALLAERRLRFLEKSIQQIAVEYVRTRRRAPTPTA